MKILTSQEARVLELSAPAKSSPAWSYVHTLLCSVVFWQNVRTDDGVKKLMPMELRPSLLANAKASEDFLKRFKIGVRGFREYVDWIHKYEPDEDSGQPEALLVDHLKSLYEALPRMKRDMEIEDLWLEVINALRLWHKTENPTTLEKINKVISKLDMPAELTNNFQVEVGDATPIIKDLRSLVKKLSGADAETLPMGLAAELREKKPEQYKVYLEKRREYNRLYDQAIREFARSKGGLVDIEAMRKYMTQKKMPLRVPKGFVGKIGEDKFLYTKEGARIANSGGIDPSSEIKMNPAYTPEKDLEGGRNNGYVFTVTLPTKDAAGKNNVQHLYTETKLQLQKQKKFGIVQELLANERQIVTRWRRDLKSKDMGQKILAAQCELSYITCARIGGKDNKNTKTGETFGLTTLLVGNLKRQGPKRILEYIGKDSVKQRHVIEPETPEMKIVIALLDQLAEGKSRKDILFHWDGVWYDAAKLRQYFKLVTGNADATPHKLRHMRGTRLAEGELQLESQKLLKKRGLTQKAVEDGFKNALLKVGNQLGHVRGVGEGQKTDWSTAAKNYVDVSVMADWWAQFQTFGIRPSGTIKRAIAQN